MKKILLILLTFISLTSFAQMHVKEGSFRQIDGFVMLDKNEHYDDNNYPMALIKISTENISAEERRKITFKGNLETYFDVHFEPSEIYLYISTCATFIEIHHPDYGKTEYWLPQDLKGFCGYEMVLVNNFNKSEVLSNSTQHNINDEFVDDVINKTLLIEQPQEIENQNKYFATINYAYSVSPQHSFGFTVGNVNKFGWYFSAMAGGEFKALTTDLHCDEYGNIDGELQLYSGNTTSSRLSGIVGAMYRPIDFMSVKFGLGYGIRLYAWETQNGNWARNDKYSVNGMEINAGLHFFLKRVSLSVDLISTNAKYFEVKFGLGINSL